MFKIVKNDLWIMRKYLIFICLYSFFFSFILKLGTQSSTLCSLSVYMFIVGLLSWEERDRINRMYKILPVKTSAIVGAKYVETMIVAILSVICCILAYSVYVLFSEKLGEAFVNSSDPFSWNSIIYAILISIILICVLIPIIYKWGYIKSRIIVILSLIVVFAIVSPIQYIANELGKQGYHSIIIISIAVTIVIMIISEKLSEYFFLKSDE